MPQTRPAATNLTDKENELIRQTFKEEDDALLLSIRALFFGLETSPAERSRIKATFESAELRAIMWKKFCPALSRDVPIGQVQDEWMGTEQMISGQSEFTVAQALGYKYSVIKTMKASLAMLENPDESNNIGDLINYNRLIDDAYGARLLARNMYIKHVETQLSFLRVIANMPPAAATVPQDKKKKGQVIPKNA